MSLKPEDSTPNSLGLDLDSLKISEDKTSPPPQQTSQKPADKPSNDTPKDTQPSPVAIPADAPIAKEDDAKSPTSAAREKKKPYVNPDRVKTGGAQRVCFSFARDQSATTQGSPPC